MTDDIKQVARELADVLDGLEWCDKWPSQGLDHNCPECGAYSGAHRHTCIIAKVLSKAAALGLIEWSCRWEDKSWFDRNASG